MKLYELAYICSIYERLTQPHTAHLAFLETTAGDLDFHDPSHMSVLLKWLNSWGCRQFAIDYHHLAAESILGWAGRWEPRLPDRLAALDHLPDQDIQRAG